MDKNYELFRIATSAVREMNTRRKRVIESGNDTSFVAYHAAELAQYANQAKVAQDMLRTVLSSTESSELYDQAWELVIEGKSDELAKLFVEDAQKRL